MGSVVVGLTGGIGTGKTRVAELLRELGAAVECSDLIVRELQSPGGETLVAIVESFGPEYLTEAGELDQAIAIYERWVEIKPEDMKVLRRLADMYLSADRRAEAASRYAEVAEHYARSGFSDLSLDTYQRVVELAPDKSEYAVRLEELQTLRQNDRDRPRGAMSGVMFSIAAPLYVAAGDSFSLDVWAHAEADLAKVVDGVATRAAESAPPRAPTARQAETMCSGTTNGAWGQPRCTRAPATSSAPSGAPWVAAVPALVGAP